MYIVQYFGFFYKFLILAASHMNLENQVSVCKWNNATKGSSRNDITKDHLRPLMCLAGHSKLPSTLGAHIIRFAGRSPCSQVFHCFNGLITFGIRPPGGKIFPEET